MAIQLVTLHAGVKTAVPSGAEFLVSIPVGGGRGFDAVAASALGTLLGAGLSASFTIVGGNLTLSSVALSLLAQGGATNGQAPIWNGTAWAPGNVGGSYTLPIATGSVLGGVKQGSGVTIAGDGTISAAGSSAFNVISIDGSTIVASTGSPYQMATADRVVDVNKATGAPTKVLLPASPTLGVEYYVIDGKSDAGTNNITVALPGSGKITGWPGGDATSIVMNSNNDAITFLAVGSTTWRIT